MSRGERVEFEIGALLRRAHRIAAVTVNDALEPLGLQGRHFGAMMSLAAEGPVSQRRLTDRAGSDKSTMVRTIDELQDRGLCRRRVSPEDRRVNLVELTEAGRELLGRARALAGAAATPLFAGLTAGQRTDLRDLLAEFVASQTDGGSPEVPGVGD
ncbi:MarR family winged helix-turn-helix transcriptional regulator [Microbacterium sp. 22242]|uniref:MarR family winged helix-turn-helix transcriptional regulator n=1 Tax=Microbacterium sp. 22242 TaxID=3453896 RepID=UPI003F870C10